jgi:hypothetical protein
MDVMKAVGARALAMIEENVRRGVGYDGRQFLYSMKPFARPIPKGFTKKRLKELEAAERIKRFRTKEGKLWMVVMHGYRDYRQMIGADPNGDFLQLTGAMMRNLNVIDSDVDTVRLGFDDPVQARKALYLSVTGAGKSRRLWRFMGITQKQQNELTEYAAGMLVEADIAKILGRMGKI